MTCGVSFSNIHFRFNKNIERVLLLCDRPESYFNRKQVSVSKILTLDEGTGLKIRRIGKLIDSKIRPIPVVFENIEEGITVVFEYASMTK